MAEFSDLLGQHICRWGITPRRDELVLNTIEGNWYRLWHRQMCCESVEIESIVGDLQDLFRLPLLVAEEVSHDNGETPDGLVHRTSDYGADSFTWTFYKLATIKGYVDIRWYGSSNGYYSESVDFEKIDGEPEGFDNMTAE